MNWFTEMNFELQLLLCANVFVCCVALYFSIFVFPRRDLSEETKRRPRSFVSNAFFREFWYFMMEPFKKKLIKWNVEPNTITLWGLVFSLFASAAFAAGKFGIGGWFVILSSTCDVYDGQLARARKITLKSGAFFDSVLDRFGEAGMFAGLLWYFSGQPVWFLVVFFGSAASQIVSYARARAESLGFDKGGSRGFFQRAERMIVLSIGMALSPFFDIWFPGMMVRLAVGFICVGSVWTALGRSIGIYREILRSERT